MRKEMNLQAHELNILFEVVTQKHSHRGAYLAKKAYPRMTGNLSKNLQVQVVRMSVHPVWIARTGYVIGEEGLHNMEFCRAVL